jgi:drug/metabolite transporter (DMT)-like permease
MQQVAVETPQSRRLTGYLLVAAAACLWGTLGIAGRMLYAAGLTPGVVVTLRASVAALLVVAALGVVRPASLRIAWRDVPYFAAYGLISVAAFYLLYFTTIQHISVAAAAVLLYTAPTFVAIVAYLLMGEPLTRVKVVALGVTLAGCALVSRAYEPGTFRAQGMGLLTGLGAGFTYGMYAIFGKHGLRKYGPWTVQAYSMLFGSLALLPVYGAETVRALGAAPQVWPVVAYLGLVPTVAAYGLYLTGLQSIESSHASIVATLEPVVAAGLGFLLLQEPLGLLQLAGMALVLAGVAVLQRSST